jgi:hypothetical protein
MRSKTALAPGGGARAAALLALPLRGKGSCYDEHTGDYLVPFAPHDSFNYEYLSISGLRLPRVIR